MSSNGMIEKCRHTYGINYLLLQDRKRIPQLNAFPLPLLSPKSYLESKFTPSQAVLGTLITPKSFIWIYLFNLNNNPMLLLLSRFSCVWLCATPQTAAHQAPPSLGFSRQEQVAISFSNVWKWKVKVKSVSRVWLLATPWTAAHHASQSMGFSRQ